MREVGDRMGNTKTSLALGSIPREDLEHERITLTSSIQDMDEQDPGRHRLLIRLANVMDEIALRDAGERSPHH